MEYAISRNGLVLPPISITTQESTGSLYVSDVIAAWNALYETERAAEAARAAPQTYFIASPGMHWRIRLARLYGVNAPPQRRLRKCHERKRQARITHGKWRLLRLRRVARNAWRRATDDIRDTAKTTIQPEAALKDIEHAWSLKALWGSEEQ